MNPFIDNYQMKGFIVLFDFLKVNGIFSAK